MRVADYIAQACINAGIKDAINSIDCARAGRDVDKGWNPANSCIGFGCH